MQRNEFSDDDQPLIDTTAAIPLNSKRTARMKRRKAIRDQKQSRKPSLAILPTELLLVILKMLSPSEVFRFSFVNQRFHDIVETNANVVGNKIIKRQYSVLAKCFQLPILLSNVESSIQALLTDPVRQKALSIHRNPYQHLRPPDPTVVCTCITCILIWNNLCVVLDFAHWQSNLDAGEPIPIIPRGQSTEWNEELVSRNARIVGKALGCSLWHARILETHLDSTIRSIRRQQANKGNKRKHMDMTPEEAASHTDKFLEKAGPPSHEFPFNRDQYYLLEAYLPRRAYSKKKEQWIYNVAGNHEQDLEYLVKRAALQNRNESERKEETFKGHAIALTR